ncbi:hypothetical protein TVAG_206920 [Trichomonas vaginalis G3]|uniref:TFIID subunit TAF5 NTD2 domain-containing protein n=1 Tax=Trichomonas vaginalis (strain ATCC PRA-98 / G3) TaxID=412133 RepID=A2EY70_TRIV3|nr:transcription initiation from RNA polymerase II promoter [Trichomonas vaginalis G3]EAY02416.1 hypothetical protein TVAG_206920 [Trichomonas vaginalis G3]KAI5535536.1 transcription initiation from RNA polymerase II promoter [Trichomonas vaginalis G3]|eukprot:XP_001330669.1 hypothetical protein [Trichomonas vaginalis G3]
MNSQPVQNYGNGIHGAQQPAADQNDIYKIALREMIKNEDVSKLPEQYDAVKNWIITSFPPESIQYRELYKILYAFFFHSIIIMSERGVDKQVVTKFMNRNTGDHHRYHDQSKLKKAVANNACPKLADNGFSLKITKTSFNTLTSFLEENYFYTFLGIIQDRLHVTYIPYEKILNSPESIPEFILPDNAKNPERRDPTLSLLKDNLIDLINQRIETIYPDEETANRLKISLFDDDTSKRTPQVVNLPKIPVEQILAGTMQAQLMAKLNKSELPACAYFTFPTHDQYYDINDDGTLISVCTGTGITKLISTNVYTDLDDLFLYKGVTAQNEKTGPGFELLNQMMVPRYPIKNKQSYGAEVYTYFNRNLIGPKPYWCKFSPNSRYLMTGGLGHVRVWNCENSIVLQEYHTPFNVNWCGDWSPFNHQIAIGCEDPVALLYDTSRQEPIRVFTQHNKPIVDLKFHPNSSLLATCSCDCSIHLWDMRDGMSLRQLADRMNVPRCMQFTRNGKLLISGDDSGAITSWDLAEGNKLGHIMAHNGPVREIAISVEGTIVASVGQEGDILLWDIENFRTSAIAQAKPLKRLQPRYADTRRIKFSNTNLLLALGSQCPAKA